MIPVHSSAIRAIGWSGGVLTVEFVSGGVYDYPRVPYSVFVDFLNASSKGTYYHKHVSGKYK
jgi:hypothetical protein